MRVVLAVLAVLSVGALCLAGWEHRRRTQAVRCGHGCALRDNLEATRALLHDIAERERRRA